VDDICQQVAPLFKKHRPESECSDDESIMTALTSGCFNCDIKNKILNQWKEYRDFSYDSSQSCFNSLRPSLMQTFLISQAVLQTFEPVSNRQGIIDILPVSVMKFYMLIKSLTLTQLHKALTAYIPIT
jgi:hypothetical protein